jgi:hypothetical protein
LFIKKERVFRPIKEGGEEAMACKKHNLIDCTSGVGNPELLLTRKFLESSKKILPTLP